MTILGIILIVAVALILLIALFVAPAELRGRVFNGVTLIAGAVGYILSLVLPAVAGINLTDYLSAGDAKMLGLLILVGNAILHELPTPPASPKGL